MRPWLRTGLKVGLLLAGTGLVTAVLVGGSAVAWLRTPAGNDFLRGRVESLVSSSLTEGSFEIEGLRTNLWNRLDLTGVRLARADGTPVLAAELIGVRLEPGGLLRRELRIRELGVDGLVVDLVIDEQGLELTRMLGLESDEEGGPWGGLPIGIEAPVVAVRDGWVRVSLPSTEVELDALSLDAQVRGSGRHIEVAELAVSTQVRSPADTTLTLGGGAAYTGDGVELAGLWIELPDSRLSLDGELAGLEGESISTELAVAVTALALADVGSLAGDLELGGEYQGNIEVRGPLSDLGLQMALRGAEGTTGRLGLGAQIDLVSEEIPWSVELMLSELHVEQIYPSLGDEVALDGKLVLDGAGLSWPGGLTGDGRYLGGTQRVYGVQIDQVDAPLHLEDGVVSLAAARLDGPVGNLVADGDLDLDQGPIDLKVTGLVRLGGLDELSPVELRGGGQVDLRFTGDLLDGSAPYRAVGSANLSPLRYERDVRMARVIGNFDVAIRESGIEVGADFLGWDGEVYGAEVDEVLGPEISVVLDAEGDLMVTGSTEVYGARYGELGEVERADAAWSVALPRAGSMVVEAEGDVGPLQALGFPSDGGDYTVQISDDLLAYVVELDAGSRQMLDSAGSWQMKTGEVHVEHLILAPTPRQEWVSPRALTFRLTEGGVADADVELASSLGTIEVRGTLGTTGELDGLVVLRELHLDTLAELFPDQVSGLSGTLDLDLWARGTAEAPELSAAIDARRVWVEGVSRWLDVAGSVQASDGSVRPDLMIGVAGEGVAKVSGSAAARLVLSDPGPDPDGPVDLLLAIRPGEIERFEWLLPDTDLPSGRLSAVVELTRTLRDPDVHLAGVAELDVPGWALPGRVEFEVNRSATLVDGYADLRDGFRPLGSLGGTGSTRAREVVAWGLGEGPEPDLSDPTLYIDDLFFATYLTEVPLSSLTRAGDIDLDAEGIIDGGVIVTGSVLEPRLEGSFTIDRLRLAEVQTEGLLFTITHGSQGYDLFAELSLPDRGGLLLAGTVPLEVDLARPREEWVTGELDVELGGEGLPLGLASAYDPGIQATEGFLVVRGKVVGSPLAPLPDLAVRIEEGALSYEPLQVRFADIDLSFTAERRQLELEHLLARTKRMGEVGRLLSLAEQPLGGGGANIDVRGTAVLDGYTPSNTSVEVKLREAWLSATTAQTIQLSGTALMTGRWPEMSITGDMKVDRAQIAADTAFFLERAPLEVDPRLAIHLEEADGVRRAPKDDEEERSLLADFEVDVGVDLRRNASMVVSMPYIDDLGAFGASVTRADVDARVGGELTVGMKDEELGVLGEVEVLEGKVQVLASTFELEGGTVSFAGSSYTNPYLDLDARMNIAGGSVQMAIQGTPEHPDIQLSSEQYPDQSQILSILLTGQAPGELDDQKALGAFAQLLKKTMIGGATFSGLSNLTIGDDFASVRISIPVSAELTAGVVLAPTANLSENRYTVEAEYQILPKMVLSGAYGTRKSWADLFYEYRF